jgi:transcriptional regulator with XRE-family HTH domain
MGKASRQRPGRLGEKLMYIRETLSLSQNGMLKKLGFPPGISREHISAFELDKREPPLPVLLRYARVAGVCLDVLVDDGTDLPKKLPGIPKHRAE